MIHFIPFIHYIFCFLLLNTCASNQRGWDVLINTRWIHSHEEDSTGVLVYRPDHFPLPPSRGREGIQLFADGTGLIGRIQPADGIQWVPLNWKKLPHQRLELSLSAKGGGSDPVIYYQIVAVETDRLLMKNWLDGYREER